jgi:hypothetical protein
MKKHDTQQTKTVAMRVDALSSTRGSLLKQGKHLQTSSTPILISCEERDRKKNTHLVMMTTVTTQNRLHGTMPQKTGTANSTTS